jgi:hypothetical protein
VCIGANGNHPGFTVYGESPGAGTDIAVEKGLYRLFDGAFRVVFRCFLLLIHHTLNFHSTISNHVAVVAGNKNDFILANIIDMESGNRMSVFRINAWP